MKKVAGHLFWRTGLKGHPVADIIPIDSGTPRGSYLTMHDLEKSEIEMGLTVLEQLYPPPAWHDEHH